MFQLAGRAAYQGKTSRHTAGGTIVSGLNISNQAEHLQCTSEGGSETEAVHGIADTQKPAAKDTQQFGSVSSTTADGDRPMHMEAAVQTDIFINNRCWRSSSLAASATILLLRRFVSQTTCGRLCINSALWPPNEHVKVAASCLNCQ